MSIFQCPVCHQVLHEQPRMWVCENKHQFDKAKSGYVNLLQSQKSRLRQRGDEKTMLQARRSFLDAGYYLPLLKTLAELVKRYEIRLLLDAGCGEGWYMDKLSKTAEVEIYGIDISKDAVVLAQKRDRNLKLAVASAAHFPFQAQSFDGVLSVFAPFYSKEIKRVLKHHGYFIHVYPDKRHLWQLKQILYPQPYENEAVIVDDPELVCVETVPVEAPLHLQSLEAIQALFMMTPYYHKTSVQGHETLSRQTELNVSMAFVVKVYRKDTDLQAGPPASVIS